MKNLTLSLIGLCLSLVAFAQGPNNSGTYYKNADGKKGSALKTALADIINPHTALSYSSLWDCYKTTDLRSDGKIWDMYSSITNFDPDKDRAGSYSGEGDVFNREHSFPKSWFDDASPMVTDLMHIVPTDGYVNGRRSNYPFGETDGDQYKSANDFSKLGTSKTEGYTGTVFEPNDEYKGDFARIYFYMVTCYESRVGSWSCDMLSGDKYPALSTWALNMLLKWAADDPVSEKEVNRNNGVYSKQKNRNPFVDYPGLEQYVWGSKTGEAFSYDNYDSTVDPTPDPDPDPDPDPTPDPDPDPDPTPEDGEQVYLLATSTSQLVDGAKLLIVCPEADMALSDQSENAKFFTGSEVTISNNQIATEVDRIGKPHQLVLGVSNDLYTFYDTVEEGYLALNSDGNALHLNETIDDNAYWTINLSTDAATITSNSYNSRSIQYNLSAPRFASYKAGQASVAIYINKVTTKINAVSSEEECTTKVYSVDGRAICNGRDFDNLPRGLYIVNGRKVVKL